MPPYTVVGTAGNDKMTYHNMTNKQDTVREKIAEQAFDWLLRLDAPDAAQSYTAEFAAWLKESPVHIEEFLTLEATWRELDRIDPDKAVQINELVATAQTNVVSLDTAVVQEPKAAVSNEMRTAKRSWLAGAAIVIVLLGSVFVTQYLAPTPDTYITALGEQSSFTLEDGSVVHLNTQSELRIRFTTEQRNVELLNGEALFQVARDPSRPFRVMAADTVVEAIGTRFNVYRDGNQTTVTVVEGKVAVHHLHDASMAAPDNAGTVVEFPVDAITLVAGEQIAVNPAGAITRVEVPDTQEVTAWRQRRLAFKDDTLATIAEQFNRYNRLRIEVNGSAAQRQLTGVFDADDPESLVEFLIGEPSIRVTLENDLISITDR